MEKKIIEGAQSNLEVQIELTADELKKYEEKALKELGKDIQIPGYRPGKAPLDEIRKKINPQYLQGAVYEIIVNEAINDLIKEGKYQLIWNIYDFKVDNKDDGSVVVSFKIDVYPEVKVKNNNYESVEPQLPNFEVTEDELNKAIEGLKAQFAEYVDTDKVDPEKSYVKLDLEYLDENGNKVGDGKVFLAKPDFEEFKILKDTFAGKEKGFSAEFDYDEEKLPQLLQYFKKDKDQLNIKKVKATISEIKEAKLPELTLENLEKWFGKKYESIEKFMEEVKETLQKEKRRIELNKFVEDLLSKIKDSFEVVLPKTLIDQEIKQRLESLKQRYGGEKNFEAMLKSMKPEDVKKLYEDITNAAKESIKNFLTLMKFAQLKGIIDKVDFKKDLDFEEKLLSIFKKDEKESK